MQDSGQYNPSCISRAACDVGTGSGSYNIAIACRKQMTYLRSKSDPNAEQLVC